jgi:hypothetical protein
MTKTPNMWRDQDEFSIARRTKFNAELLRTVRERNKTRPEPKNRAWEEPPICTADETDCQPPLSLDGEVLQFKEYQSEQARQDSMNRAHSRQRASNWRLMQERDEKRKRQEELQGELTET